MKLTIIPADKSVYVDGHPYFDMNLNWIPEINGKTIHAVQWDSEKGEGEIEFVGDAQNHPITSLEFEEICDFSKAIELWTEKKEEEEALLKQRLEDEERMRKEQEELMQAQFLQFQQEFNQSHLPALEEDAENEEEELFYDIEELLKEI